MICNSIEFITNECTSPFRAVKTFYDRPGIGTLLGVTASAVRVVALVLAVGFFAGAVGNAITFWAAVYAGKTLAAGVALTLFQVKGGVALVCWSVYAISRLIQGD